MLDEALEIAKANPVLGLPKMGALLAYRGKIKAVGFNQRKTHPLQKKYQPNPMANCLHAEIDCIKNALRKHSVDDLKKFTMYIARARKDGLPSLAKPCYGCSNALVAFGITKVIWTEDEVKVKEA